MSNELTWIVLTLLSFSALWGIKMLFGVNGLFVWTGFSIITANILVLLQVTLFGFTATLGNIHYGASFAVTDTLCELRGKREAQKAVWIGFYIQLCFTAVISIALLFMPATGDFAHPHLQQLFQILPRITIASLVAYIISQTYDVWIFKKIHKYFPARRMLWLRNNASTLSSQLLDTLIFCPIAFYGILPLTVVVEIMVTTYLFKVIVALLDTPFVYLLTRHKSSEA